MKRRGSALIIAMMMIATIGAIAFGIAKLLFADSNIATIYENGSLAYYAAESGIEEGFLRYKFNRNAEIPYAKPSSNLYWTFGQDTVVFRNNLTDKTVTLGTDNVGINFSTAGAPAPAKQIFDLRMGFLGYGNMANFQLDESKNNIAPISNYVPITRDNSLEIDLSELGTEIWTGAGTTVPSLSVIFTGITDTNGNGLTDDEYCKALLEVKYTIDRGSGPQEYKELLTYNPAVCKNTLNIDQSKLATISSISSTPQYLLSTNLKVNYGDMRPIFTQAGQSYPTSGNKVKFSVRPLNYNAAIFMSSGCSTTCTNKTNILPGPYSYITSVGNYGGVTRKLTANIDRQSGSLYDLYDYVIFKTN